MYFESEVCWKPLGAKRKKKKIGMSLEVIPLMGGILSEPSETHGHFTFLLFIY